MGPADHAENTRHDDPWWADVAETLVGVAFLDDSDDRILDGAIELLHVLRPCRPLDDDLAQVFADVDVDQRVVLAERRHQRDQEVVQLATWLQTARLDAGRDLGVLLDDLPQDLVEQFFLRRDVVVDGGAVDLEFFRHGTDAGACKTLAIEHPDGGFSDFLAPLLVTLARVFLRGRASLADAARALRAGFTRFHGLHFTATGHSLPWS